MQIEDLKIAAIVNAPYQPTVGVSKEISMADSQQTPPVEPSLETRPQLASDDCVIDSGSAVGLELEVSIPAKNSVHFEEPLDTDNHAPSSYSPKRRPLGDRNKAVHNRGKAAKATAVVDIGSEDAESVSECATQ